MKGIRYPSLRTCTTQSSAPSLAHSCQNGARQPPTSSGEGQSSYLRKFPLLAGGDLAVEEGRLLNLTLLGERGGEREGYLLWN